MREFKKWGEWVIVRGVFFGTLSFGVLVLVCFVIWEVPSIFDIRLCAASTIGYALFFGTREWANEK